EIKTSEDLSAFRVGSYTIRSTLDSELQRATESALQEGLARYERNAGRLEFRGPEANLAAEIERLRTKESETPDKPLWRQALEAARLPLADVHWDAAVVIEKGAERRGGGAIRVGLADGRTLPLDGPGSILRTLNLYDVVLVQAT